MGELAVVIEYPLSSNKMYIVKTLIYIYEQTFVSCLIMLFFSTLGELGE